MYIFLAHNNLIGRIIGKQGSTIKRIMEETDSKITVSSINDINSFNMERIITIRGDPEKICKAEAEISVKLRQAFESDLNSLPVSTSFVFSQKVVGVLISQPFFQKLFLYLLSFSRLKMSCFQTFTRQPWLHQWVWVWQPLIPMLFPCNLI